MVDSSTTLLSCSLCLLNSPQSIAMAGLLGGWASFVFMLQPHKLARRMPKLWGVPRFRLTDFLSLIVLVLGPLLLAQHGLEDHGAAWVTTCFMVFTICLTFLWLRGLWILEQLEIRGFGKRTLFLAVLLPAIVAFGLIVGHWMLTALILFLGTRGDLSLLVTLLYAIAAGINYVCVRWGLNFVFGRPDYPKPLYDTRTIQLQQGVKKVRID